MQSTGHISISSTEGEIIASGPWRECSTVEASQSFGHLANSSILMMEGVLD